MYTAVQFPDTKDGGLLISVDLDDPDKISVVCSDPHCDHKGSYCNAWIARYYFISQANSYIVADNYDRDDRTVLYICTKDKLFKSKDGEIISAENPNYQIYRYDPVANVKEIVTTVFSQNINRFITYGDYIFFSDGNNVYSCDKESGQLKRTPASDIIKVNGGKLYYKDYLTLYRSNLDLQAAKAVTLDYNYLNLNESNPAYIYNNALYTFTDNVTGSLEFDGTFNYALLVSLRKFNLNVQNAFPIILSNIVYDPAYFKISNNRLYYIGTKADKKIVTENGADRTVYTLTNDGTINIVDIDTFNPIGKIDTGVENSTQLVECNGDYIIYKTTESGVENYHLSVMNGKTYDLGSGFDLSAIIK